MSRNVTGATRLLSGALALALAVISSLTCFIGTAAMPQMSPSPHACCERMNTDCPTSTASVQQNDCCATQAASTTAIATDRFAPPLVAVAAVPFLTPPPTVVRSAAVSDADVLKSSSPPTYLLDSVFRI